MMHIPARCLAMLLLVVSAQAQEGEQKWHPGHYALVVDHALLAMTTDPAMATRAERLIAALPAEFIGVQGGAYWRNLEPEPNRYDFSVIEMQLRFCATYKKQFFCTVADKQFGNQPTPVPDYIINDPAYHGGLVPFKDGKGSQARIWDPAVLVRFNKLVAELGKRFDREPHFEGVEFIETALNIDASRERTTPEEYIAVLRQRLVAARAAFPTSVVLQETNWLPGTSQEQMGEFFRFCCEAGVGIGGPDLIPDAERAPERPRIPSYEFFPRHAGRMPLALDVQEPEYLGRVGNRNIGKLTPAGIFDMGVNRLKLNYIFWCVYDRPKANFTFSGGVVPYVIQKQGAINAGRPANLDGRRP